MIYTIKDGKPIKTGRKLVRVFEVRDETGAVRANCSTEDEARQHMKVLEEADKRNSEAEEASEKKDA